MNTHRLVFLILALCLAGWSLTLHADDDTGNSTAEEFKIKQQYMHERVNDFYGRLDQMDREDQARESASGEMRKQRAEIARTYEKSREDFVKQRKARPPEDPMAFEKELTERRKAYDLARRDFVRRRDLYEKQKKSFDSIPEEEELGIEPEDTN